MKKFFIFLVIFAIAASVSGAGSQDSKYDSFRRLVFESIDNNSIGTAAGRGPSPLIWSTCPVVEYMINPQEGMVYFNDFTAGVVVANNKTAAQAAATGTVGAGITACTGATSGTAISTLTTDVNGVIKLESTTDNEDCVISLLGGQNTAGMVRFTAGKQLWMEARVSVLNITNSKFNAFFGFAEEALTATGTLITTSDAMGDKDYVGFQRVFADGDMLDTVYATTSATATTVGADAVTMEAGTFKKIGLYCDGTTVYFYADGVLLDDSVAIATDGFPDGEEMAWYAALMLGHGDTASIQIDWVRIAMEY
jgi:hypothetical protein